MLEMLRKRMKFIKTGNLYLGLFTLGMAISVTGPCLLDLQHMVRTDTQHIAMVYTARSIGYLLGSIIVGVILDLTKFKQAVLMACNFFITITMFGIPWSRNVETLLGFMCVNGFFLGALETGSNVLVLELWGKDSSPIFQGLHFAYSVGGLIAPLIAAPFLGNDSQLSGYIDNATSPQEEPINSTVSFLTYATNVTPTLEVTSNIIYPFSITGVVALLITIFCVIVCIISPTEDKNVEDDSKTDNSEKGFLYKFSIAIFTFLIYVVVAGSEIGYGQTLTEFAVKGKLHLTTTQGSYITSTFWAALILSRLAGVYLSIKISSLKLLIIDLCIVSIASVILLFFMLNELALWIASVIFGVGIASVYGIIIGWINIYIRITSKFAALFTVGCATGEMVVPFIITYFIDTIPEMFSFVTAASVILMMVFLSALNCIFKSGKKINESKNLECYVIETVEKIH